MLAATGIKAGIQLWQGIKARKEEKKLDASQPKLGVTEGEIAANKLYEQQAAATEMPGQRQAEDKMSQAVAEGVEASQRSSISSLGATKSANDLAMAKIQSIQDLSMQFAEYKQKRMDQLAGWKEKQIDLEQQRFKVNEYDPWNVRKNENVSEKKAAWEGLAGTVDQGLGMWADLRGTKMFTEALGKLGQAGDTTSAVSNVWGKTPTIAPTKDLSLYKINPNALRPPK